MEHFVSVEDVDQIALLASTSASSNAKRPISAQETASASAAQNQNIIHSLHQARATGRVVLEMSPDRHDVAALLDFPLEDGDRLIVSRVPSTVRVDGAVYNQSTFLYDPRPRVGGYRQLAGGASRDADAGRSYVIAPEVQWSADSTTRPGCVEMDLILFGFIADIRLWSP